MGYLLKIWKFMGDNYGALWTREFGNVPTGENSWAWTVAIKGLTAAQITTGVEKVIEKCLEYPPKPIQFRGLCLNADNEAADLLFNKVVNWRQLDQEAKCREGLFIIQNIFNYPRFKELNTERAREVFDKAYERLIKHVEAGKELPNFPPVIDYKPKPPMDEEQKKAFFGSLFTEAVANNPRD